MSFLQIAYQLGCTTEDDEMGSIGECEADVNGNNTTFLPTPPQCLKTSRGNLFKYMSLFFRENALSMKANYFILMSMLEDFQLRKGYTFPTLLGQLRDFCNRYESDNSRFFIRALLDINRSQGGIFESDHVRELIFLLWNEAGNFSDLLGTACSESPYQDPLKPDSEELRRNRHRKSMEDLTYFLRHAGTCRFQIRSFVRDAKDANQLRLMDYPLNYGESPLMSASRHRKPDVILTLLRHGAIIESNWMCYKSALEVLLLAPNLIYLNARELRNIELAAQYYARACTRINQDHIQNLIKEGYFPLHDRWQQLIPEARYSQPCSLRQICRIDIRKTLNRKCELPHGIQLLPLPPILMEYLDLQRD